MLGARDHIPAEPSLSETQERGPVRDPSEKMRGAPQTRVQHPTPSPQLSCQNCELDCVSFGVEGGGSSWSNPPMSAPPPPLWEVPGLTLAGMCLKGEAAWGCPGPRKGEMGMGT